MDLTHVEASSISESDNKGMPASTPFFSIGVTTYNRRALLKQTLLSIMEQTFPDFEVIVGNDYTQETLSASTLGIEDPRIRFVNHPQNLGELGNMNALLGMARGRYFTWQFDDDLYMADFLQCAHGALVKFGFPTCVFTSYRIIEGNSIPDFANFLGQDQLLSGRQFLRMYLSSKLKAMGCAGVYDTDYLKRIGGVARLADGPIALYSEYLLLVQAGLLEKVAYINAPLVSYRSHEGSWGCTNTEVDQYKQAGENLVRESVRVFSSPGLRDDFSQNLLSILEFPLNVFLIKLEARDGYLNRHEVMAYLFSMKKEFHSLKGSFLYWIALASLCRAGVRLIYAIIISKFTSTAPSGLVKLARKLRSVLPRCERKAFWG